jgi:hypothetical protein
MSNPSIDPIPQLPPLQVTHSPSGATPPLQEAAYPSPYQPFYPPYGAALVRADLPASPLAIWSMMLGIVGLVAGCLIYYLLVFVPGNPISTASHVPVLLGFITFPAAIAIAVPWSISIVAIVLGHITLTQVRRGLAGGRGFAIWGLVMGYVNIILPVAGLVLEITLFITICTISPSSCS